MEGLLLLRATYRLLIVPEGIEILLDDDKKIEYLTFNRTRRN